MTKNIVCLIALPVDLVKENPVIVTDMLEIPADSEKYNDVMRLANRTLDKYIYLNLAGDPTAETAPESFFEDFDERAIETFKKTVKNFSK